VTKGRPADRSRRPNQPKQREPTEPTDPADSTDPTDPAARLDALLSPAGQALLDRLAVVEVSGDAGLRLGQALRKEYPADLVAAALAQHELRLVAREKFSRAMRMFFTRPGLEQASAEPVARHRAVRYASAETVADLCTGIGGDLIALAATSRVRAIDLDPVRLRVADLHRSGPAGRAPAATCR
jgi:hypothetical protein